MELVFEVMVSMLLIVATIASMVHYNVVCEKKYSDIYGTASFLQFAMMAFCVYYFVKMLIEQL